MTTAHRHRSRGISSAEMLAAIVLTLVITGALYSFQRVQMRAFASQNIYSESQTSTRTAVEIMARELRMASYDPTLAALPLAPGPNCPTARQGIVEATPTRVHFRQDLNADGAIAGSGEDVTYELVGGSLMRTEGAAAPVVLVSGIPANGLVFQYFNVSNPPVELMPVGAPAAVPAGLRDCIAKVRMVIRAELADPRLPNPLTSISETEVAIRNRSLDNF